MTDDLTATIAKAINPAAFDAPDSKIHALLLPDRARANQQAESVIETLGLTVEWGVLVGESAALSTRQSREDAVEDAAQLSRHGQKYTAITRVVGGWRKA